jgi:hypothetical protein
MRIVCGMGGNLSKAFAGIIFFALLSTALAAGLRGAPANSEPSIEQLGIAPLPSEPAPTSAPPGPAPNVLVGGDFLISYGDGQNALTPALAITQPGSNKVEWDGSMHAVWSEQNESDPYTPHRYEIHYSMSLGKDGGRVWTNDKNPPGDKIISMCRKGLNSGTRAPGYVADDAVDPAIAVDMWGFIHVVWRQMYSDGSWEIVYSRSTDNGVTWTGFNGNIDKVVSYREGGGADRPIPNGPSVAVSNDRDANAVVIHVVWAGYWSKGEDYEVMYSRSTDNGATWSGSTADRVISTVAQMADAISPVVATSGKFGEVVNVAWLQNDLDTKWNEIFVVSSDKMGLEWMPEQLASLKADDGLNAKAPAICSNMDFTAITWAQQYKTTGTSEIMYSYTKDFGATWLGWEKDYRISRADGQNASLPSVSIAPNGRAYAAWTEVDQNKWGSVEVHVSENADVTNPGGWSGLKSDHIISYPDADKGGVPANAGNVSAAMGYLDGAWRFHAVWDEVNYTDAMANSVVSNSWEIIIDSIADHSMPVVLGWNLVSVPLEQDYTDPLTVFNDRAGDGQTTWSRILWYDAADKADHWKQYNKNWGSALNDFTSISLVQGVWIYITSVGDGYLTMTGHKPTSNAIMLYAGWNLVGYPAQDDKNYFVSNLKAQTGATAVEGFKSAATYKTYVMSDVELLRKGYAYWICVPSDTIWTVDW